MSKKANSYHSGVNPGQPRRGQRSRGAGSLYKRNGTGPWVMSWFDATGRRRQRSTRTTDRAAAERILAKVTSDEALRQGWGHRRAGRPIRQGGKAAPGRPRGPEYVQQCRRSGQNARHLQQKERHLRRLIEHGGLHRLGDLEAEALEAYLASLEASGRGARTQNFARQIAVAFGSWCVKNRRLRSNPLKVVPKRDEARDRRRTRRPLTDEEFARLLEVARDAGRAEWYLAAGLAGTTTRGSPAPHLGGRRLRGSCADGAGRQVPGGGRDPAPPGPQGGAAGPPGPTAGAPLGACVPDHGDG